MTNNEIATIDDNADRTATAIAAMISGGINLYSTIHTDSFVDRMRLNNALADSDGIGGHLDTWITVKDIVAQQVEFSDTDEVTGEELTTTGVMVVLIDDSGKAYRVFSSSVFRDLQRTLKILGEPADWPLPVQMRITQHFNGKNRFFRLSTRIEDDTAK